MSHRIERFYLLDLLRVLAAYAVVLMHVRYFYLEPGGGRPEGFEVSGQAMYWLLYPIYENGATAVQIFFCMSGFIFFWLYRDSIERGETTGRNFFVLRFSRLYPLHFVTLIFVAAAQWAFSDVSGGYIAFGPNTVDQFIYQLFLATEWGLSGPSSFNGPIWTVSGEVFAYALFFVVAALGGANWRAVLVIMLIAGLVQEVNNRLGHALLFFFLGGMIYFVWRDVVLRLPLWRIRYQLLPVAVLLLVACCVAVSMLTRFERIMVLWFGVAPLVVFIAVLLQTCWHSLGRSTAAFGDLTYAVYLTHFPLQLVIIGTMWSLGLEIELTEFGLIAYLAGVTLISWFTFHRFELPMQRMLRRRLRGTRVAAPTPVPDAVPDAARSGDMLADDVIAAEVISGTPKPAT